MPTRTFRGATNSNWGTASNWLEGAVPLITDDVVFDASSPNCTVDSSARVALSVTFAAYTNTISMTFGITVSGNVTLGASMTILGAGVLTINATSTIESNGKTWPNDMSFTGSISVTLSSAILISGTFTAVVGNMIINGHSITTTGSMDLGSVTSFTGTTDLKMTGTGTLSSSRIDVDRYLNIEINTTGVITLGNLSLGSILSKPAPITFTKTAGTVIAAPNSLLIIRGNVQVSLVGVTLNNLATFGTQTTTLVTDLYCVSFSAGPATFTGGKRIFISKDLRTTDYVSGDVSLVMTGTGSVAMLYRGVINGCTIMIDSTGTINIASLVLGSSGSGGGRFIYVRGKITTTNATCSIQADTDLIGIDKIPFSSVVITVGQTVTMDRFFSGTPRQITTIQSTTNDNYTVNFSSRQFTEHAKFVKVSNCTLTQTGKLLVTTKNADGGGNSGIRFGSSSIQGFPRGEGVMEQGFDFQNNSMSGFSLLG